MTPPKTPFEAMLDAVEWTSEKCEVLPPEGGLPYATHHGVLKMAGLSLDVYRLSTGEAVIGTESMHRFLEWMEGGDAL